MQGDLGNGIRVLRHCGDRGCNNSLIKLLLKMLIMCNPAHVSTVIDNLQEVIHVVTELSS
jgi:hypothetical protein